MRRQTQSPKGTDGFSDSPIPASDLLIPVTSWIGMICESKITGVEFDQFWYDSIKDEVCYFFRWLGKPRSTVLVVFNHESLNYIECRKRGDQLVQDAEAERIIAEVVKQFRNAGYWKTPPLIDEKLYLGEQYSTIQTFFEDYYEDPDYSEAEDHFSDPIAAIRWARRRAKEIGLTDVQLDLLFPFPTLNKPNSDEAY